MKTYEKKKIDPPECRYNPGVVCLPGERDCDGCGWDPDVAKARLNLFCSANRTQIPHEKNGKLT